MTQDKLSPLRARMPEDMRIRGMGDQAQKSHIIAVKDFVAFLGHAKHTTEAQYTHAATKTIKDIAPAFGEISGI